VYNSYFPYVEQYGGEKQVDGQDRNPAFFQVYFEALQRLQDDDVLLLIYLVNLKT
jgi:hypothetical protein